MKQFLKGISPKLIASIAPPLTAAVTAAILHGSLDRTSLAAIVAIVIAAVAGYHAPAVSLKPSPLTPLFSPTQTTSSSGGTTMTTVLTTSPSTPSADESDDGDDKLPAELAGTPVADSPPPDEIDQPDPTPEATS